MSQTKQCWMIYQAVRHLEPEANLSRIRHHLESEFDVVIGSRWIKRRLDRFTNKSGRATCEVVLCEEQSLNGSFWHTVALRRQDRTDSD